MYPSLNAGLNLARNISGGTGVCMNRSERFGHVFGHRAALQPQDYMELRGMAGVWSGGRSVVERKGSE